MKKLSSTRAPESIRNYRKNNVTVNLKIVLINIFIILIFYRFNLLGHQTIPYDIQWYQFPHYSYLFQHLKEFAIPIWDPYTYGGGPYFANSQNQLFYLPNFFYALLNSLLFTESTIRQLQLFQIINHFIFILGLSFLSYNIKKNIYTAISISIICGFSGIFISDLQHVGQINSITWIPWLLLSLQKIRDNKMNLAWKLLFIFSLLFILTGGFIIALLPIFLIILIYGFDKFVDFKELLKSQKLPIIVVSILTLLSLIYPFIWSRENFGQSATNFDLDIFDTITVLFPNYFNSFFITQYSGLIDITKGYFFIGPILIFLSVTFFRLEKIKKIKIITSIIIWTLLFSDRLVQSVTNSQTLSLFRPIEFRVLILFTIFYLLNWLLDVKIKKELFMFIGFVTLIYATILIIEYNKFNNIIVFFSVLLCLIYLSNLLNESIKISLTYSLCAIFILVFHSFVPNQIWKAEGSGNYFNERYMRGGNPQELATLRNLVDQNSRIATSSFSYGGDFWNGWRVWSLRSVNGWEPHINQGFGEFAQNESSQKNNRFFGDFDLNSEWLKAFAVNAYITSDTNSISTDWVVYQNNSFNIAKRKDTIRPVNLSNCRNIDDLKYEYSVDKYSVPKYEISLNDNSTNCILHISEIFREDWVISDLPENRLKLTPDKFNTLQIMDISGVSKIEISIEKDNYLRIFLLYYLIILFYVLFLIRDRIFVHDK